MSVDARRPLALLVAAALAVSSLAVAGAGAAQAAEPVTLPAVSLDSGPTGDVNGAGAAYNAQPNNGFAHYYTFTAKETGRVSLVRGPIVTEAPTTVTLHDGDGFSGPFGYKPVVKGPALATAVFPINIDVPGGTGTLPSATVEAVFDADPLLVAGEKYVLAFEQGGQAVHLPMATSHVEGSSLEAACCAFGNSLALEVVVD